jgi:hypothetical protein
MSEKEKEKNGATEEVEISLLNGQLELFCAQFTQPPPPIKGDQHSTQYPLFSLQTIKPDKEVREIEVPGRNPIKIRPAYDGMANIDDKKILTYIVSQMAAAKNAGHSLYKKDKTFFDWVEINTGDLYRVTTGATGSATWSFRESLKKRLYRLSGTQYEIDLEIGGENYSGVFSFIGDFIVPRRAKGHHGKLFVQIQPWVVKMVEAWGILTYHPDYYLIESPLKRQIYEIALYHVRYKKKQSLKLETLKKMTGSRASIKNFKQQIKKIFEDEKTEGICDLLDYVMTFDPDQEMVFFTQNSEFLAKRSLENRLPE